MAFALPFDWTASALLLQLTDKIPMNRLVFTS
jgi:hypothetical protein